jgi:putative ABC transport system substrate-binding protein
LNVVKKSKKGNARCYECERNINRRGYVDSLSHPGRNASGFTSFEFGMGGQWLQLLKETAPGVMGVAVLRDPVITAGIGYLAVLVQPAVA